MRNYKIDTHTHTIVSKHAYNTLDEMITHAEKIGMELICITEHGPNMTGDINEFYFSNYRVLKNKFPIPVLLGVEANILNKHGDIDIVAPESFDYLDLVIASIHNYCYEEKDLLFVTNAIVKAIEHPHVNIIGHPDDRYFNYEEIVHAAKENKVLLELNNTSNNPSGFRKGARERDLEMLELCKKYNTPISLGSDAHCKYDIGDFSYIYPILEEVNFPEKLIANTSAEKMITLLKKDFSIIN